MYDWGKGKNVMQRKKYLVKNTALFALNSIGTRLITFFLVPLYTVAFSTAEYGTIDLITTIATILVPIITINIGEAVMRFSLDENADNNAIMSVGIFFTVLSLFFGFGIVMIITLFTEIKVNSWIIYFYCILQGMYQTFSCNLRGQEKLFQYAVANIISTFMSAILNIVFLIVFQWGITGYFLVYIISYIISVVYCAHVGNILKIIKNYHVEKNILKNMAKYSIVLVPNSLMWWIMNSSDHIMVTSMVGIAANGVYAISYKLPSILSSLSTVFNQAWAYSAIHENESSDRDEFNNAMYDKLLSFQLIITVSLMCIVKPFLKIYVQPSYYEAWKYIPYLLVGYFFLTLGTFLSTSYTVNKDSKGFLYSGLTGAAINVLLNWILIPIYGVHGAALATSVSYIIVFLYRVIDTKKYINIHVFKTSYIIGYVLVIVTAFTMMIGGKIGQVLLLIELSLIFIINKKFLKECIKMLQDIREKIFKKRI